MAESVEDRISEATLHLLRSGGPLSVTVEAVAANSGVALSDASQDAPAYKTTPPSAAAAVIVDAVVKGKYRATIGSDAAAMDKLSRLSPRRATTLIARQMGALLT